MQENRSFDQYFGMHRRRTWAARSGIDCRRTAYPTDAWRHRPVPNEHRRRAVHRLGPVGPGAQLVRTTHGVARRRTRSMVTRPRRSGPASGNGRRSDGLLHPRRVTRALCPCRRFHLVRQLLLLRARPHRPEPTLLDDREHRPARAARRTDRATHRESAARCPVLDHIPRTSRRSRHHLEGVQPSAARAALRAHQHPALLPRLPGSGFTAVPTAAWRHDGPPISPTTSPRDDFRPSPGSFRPIRRASTPTGHRRAAPR